MIVFSFMPVNLANFDVSCTPASPEVRQARYTPRNVWLRPFAIKSSGWTKYRYGFEMKTTRG